MKANKTNILFFIATLGILGLIAMQLNWMRQTSQLKEEIFNQRVSMAVCTAAESCRTHNNDQDYKINTDNSKEGIELKVTGITDNKVFEKELAKAIDSHELPATYQMDCCKPSFNFITGKTDLSCEPLDTNNIDEAETIAISFPDNRQSGDNSMKMMLLSTIIILSLITSIFLFTSWTFWKQKKQAQKNIDFFNNLAHEFRTPLTNIGLASTLLAKDNKSRLVNIIQHENKKLSHQVEQVLTLASMENGDYQLQKTPISILELLKEVVADFQLSIDEKNAVINMDNLADATIKADRLHLTNVFKNLLDNALKYADKQPVIDISTKLIDNTVHIFFKDNGIGICKADQSYIFEKFQRVTTGNVHDRKGFGLGLTYVQKIVAMHQGLVNVVSEAGKGSQFEVVLPNPMNA